MFGTSASRLCPVAPFYVACLLLPVVPLSFPACAAAASVEDFLTGLGDPLVGVSYSRQYADTPLPGENPVRQISLHFKVVHFFNADPELLDAAAARDLCIILSVPNERLSVLDTLADARAHVS